MSAPPTRTDTEGWVALLALSVVSGVLATPPGLSWSFWIGHPWLSIPLFLRSRDASLRGAGLSALLGRALVAGGVSGAIVGVGVAVVERWQSGASLPVGDLLAHLVYPLVGMLFAAVASAAGHRYGSPAAKPES